MATISLRSPVSAVKHGLALLSIIWQGLFLLSEVAGGLTSDWEPLYFITITATWLSVIAVTWGPLAQTRLRDVAYFGNILMLLAWAAVFFIVVPSDGEWEQGASITNIAVGLIGFLVTMRIAWILIALVAMGEVLALLAASNGFSPRPSLGVDVLYGVYAITIGYVSMFARLALLRAAGRAEVAQANLLTEQIHARAMHDATRQLDDDERRVHATVLNTLTAFARGSLQDEEQIRNRAQESVIVLRDLVPKPRDRVHASATSWRESISVDVERAGQSGLHVEVLDRMKQDPPNHVGLAFAAAVDEAVSNAIRHSNADHLTIALRHSQRLGFLVEISDNGIGLPENVKPRFGMRHGITMPMQDVGGTAEIVNRDTSGVAVRLRWRKKAPDAQSAMEVSGILASFAMPVLVLMWVFVTLRFLISIGEYTSLGGVLAAYLWYTVLVVIMLVITRRGSIPPAALLGLVVAAPLVYVGQTAGLLEPTDAIWASWSSEAVVSLFLVLIGAGQWWAFAPVLGMWVLMQGDVLAEIIAPGFVILVATAFFARSVRRNLVVLSESIAESVRIEASALSASQHMEALNQRFEITQIGNAIPLLTGIAHGSVDVHDPNVQAAALREERLIRSVLRLNPQRSQLDRFLGELAQVGYQRGCDVEIDTQVGLTVVDPDELDAFRTTVLALLTVSDPSTTARLTITQEGPERIVRFVVSCSTNPDTVLPTSPVIAVHKIEGEATWLVEWRVADARSHR
jgi:signal transduction histidine kinase